MKQSDGKNTIPNPSVSRPPSQQPISILRRSSTGGASKKKKNNNSAAASFNQSAPTIDTEYDAHSDGSQSPGGFVNNEHLEKPMGGKSKFTPITDPNELADRLLKYQRSFASSSSAAGHNGGGHRHRPPPPPPPRSTSAERPRSQVMSPSAKDPDLQADDISESACTYYCDEAEDEYVRRMARIKLDQSDRSANAHGNASSSEYCSHGFQSEEMNASSRSYSSSSTKNPPPFLPFSEKTKNDELDNMNLNESSLSANSNKFNSSSMTVTSSKDSFVPRPVRVSQFEDKWEAQLTNTPPSEPKMTMASSLLSTAQSHHATKNIASSPSQSSVSSTPENCDKRGRCKYHPQHKLYKKKLLGGYEFISNCPMCVAKLEGRNRSRSGDSNYSTLSAKSPSAKMSGRSSSRGRERGRSKSVDRMPMDEDYDSSEAGPGRMRTGRANSVEQQHHHGGNRERQRRPRTRSADKGNELRSSLNSNNSSGRGKSLANALDNIRDKLPSHSLPPPLLKKHQSLGDGRKDLRALDKGKRGSSRDMPPKMSSSYDETATRKKKSLGLGNNPFVHEDGELNFDKKTGRCKKHPSVLLAKKSTFRPGTWEIIKKNGCPFCAEAKADSDLDEVGQGLDKDTKRKMDLLLKGGQDISGDTSSPQWSRKADSRKTSSLRGGTIGNGNSTAPNQHVIDTIPREGLRGKKVSRLLYTTPMGETGWYTGEVDFEGKPHGNGRMRYKTGHSYEGEWIHGFGEVHMENLNRIKSGFGTNKAAWKQSEIAPSVRKTATGASTLSSSPSTMHQYQQQPSHQGYLSAQMQREQLQHAQMQQAQLQMQQQAQMQQTQLQQQQAQMQQTQLQQAQMQQTWANMSPQERQMAMTQWYASVGYQMQGYPPM